MEEILSKMKPEKLFEKTFQKPMYKCVKVWYNIITGTNHS